MQPQEISESTKKTLEGGKVSRILSIKLSNMGFPKPNKIPGSSRRPLSELSPDEIDYEQLKRKEGPKGSVCVDIEDGVLEENCKEIVIDTLLDISDEDLRIVLQN